MSTTKVESECGGDRHNSDLESALTGAHTEADRRRNLLSKVSTNLFPSRRLLGLRAVWRELFSLPSRIAILRRNNWFRYGIPLESLSQRENLPPNLRNKYRRARIRGIQKLCSIHPAPSPLDFYILARTIGHDLFAEDLDKAEEYRADISHRKD